jgi:hypothetical protein
MIEEVEARQRNFTEEFLEQEVCTIKEGVKRREYYNYFDEYDIGASLLLEQLGNKYSIIRDIDAAGYSMYTIVKENKK